MKQKKQCLYCDRTIEADETVCFTCELKPPNKIFPKQTCPYCGDLFTPTKEGQPVCFFCRKDYAKDQRKNESNLKSEKQKKPREPISLRSCPYCDKQFDTNRKDQITCGSSDCKEEHRRYKRHGPRTFRKCQYCEKRYTNISKPTCRNYACIMKLGKDTSRRAAHTRRLRLIESGGVVEMPSINWVKEQDGQCARCDADINLVKFHVHHIKPVSKGGDNSRENLEALCIPCHYEAHRELNARHRQGV